LQGAGEKARVDGGQGAEKDGRGAAEQLEGWLVECVRYQNEELRGEVEEVGVRLMVGGDMSV
jgi:hypothetical protein